MRRNDILEKEAQIRKWIAEYRSKAFICSQLQCKPLTLESYLSKLNIIYKGNKGGKGRTSIKKLATDYLYKGSTINPHNLRLKLIRDEIKVAECEGCKSTNWLGGSIPLELHHINGDRHDNRLENLQLLCPNCHALTDNHAGKSKSLPTLAPKEAIVTVDKSETDRRFISVLVFDSAKSRESWHKVPLRLRQLVNKGDGSYSCQFAHGSCLYCGKLLTGVYQDTFCSQQCSYLASRRCERPSKEELEKIVWIKPTIQIAKDFGVSDKAVEKWCKTYDINKPPRGYWAKKQYSKL